MAAGIGAVVTIHVVAVVAFLKEGTNAIATGRRHAVVGAIVAIDNGQFGFLRVSDVQNSELINYSEMKNTQTFALSANYPNPFNPSTEIPYFIAKRGLVNIDIIDVRGNHIISLVNRYQPAGKYSTYWKGTNEKNELVPAGIYFYRLAAGENSEVRKMVLLK